MHACMHANVCSECTSKPTKALITWHEHPKLKPLLIPSRYRYTSSTHKIAIARAPSSSVIAESNKKNIREDGCFCKTIMETDEK